MVRLRYRFALPTKTLLVAALLFCVCAAARAQQQPAQPAPAQPAQAQPAAAQPAAAQPAPAPLPPVATPPAPSEDPVPPGIQLDPEAAALARRQWLMRARAQRAAAERGEEPEPERVHGDAGAPFAIGIGIDTQLHDDVSYDLFDDDDLAPAFALWLAYDVLAVGSSAFIAAEVGWQYESQQSEDLLGGVLESELHDHTLTAGVQLRFVPIAVLQPHLRLVGGVSIVDMDLHASADGDFSDGGVAPIGSAGIGFTLRTPTRMFETRSGQLSSLSFGLMFEVGYTLAGTIPLSLEHDGSDARAIPITASELGDLSSSGPYGRATLATRF